ncbi:MAG: hypothetical protein XD91_1648 [Clostridiales bacterium 38_11]|nr:MAG: hypothetical protein XD91_1648 [Clostridiales bacterium 38_11]
MINKYIHNKKGVTLIELMITLAIFGIVLTTIFSINIFGLRTFSLSKTSSDNQFEVRMPTDFIAKKIRYADTIKISTNIPATPTPGSHQIYLESGNLVYKDAGTTSQIIGATGVGDYTFSISKVAGTTNVIKFTVGKSGTTKFDLTTDVIGLNLDKVGITGDTTGIYVEFFTDNADAIVPVSIISLIDPPAQFVPQNNPVSTPLRVTANMSDTSTRQVAARWNPATIDTSTTGIKTSIGRAIGYPGTVEFKVFVGNYEITNIDPISLTINQGQPFSMPTTVEAEYSDGFSSFTQNVEVESWSDTITSSSPGTFTSAGTVSGYVDEDGNPKVVELIVTVNGLVINSISNITETINQGVTYNLPSEIPANMSDGSLQSIPVVWSPTTLDTLTAGIKTSTGTVSGYGTISLTLTVNQSNIPTPIATIVTSGNNGVVKVYGLVGATATLRDKKNDPLGTGTIGPSGEVEITGVKTNQLHDVVLTKTGWNDSLPYNF